MQLFYSGNSPYARRARLAVRGAGLSNRVEEIDVAPLSQEDHLLLGHGPGGKVPGLLTDGGTFLCETLIITRYLNDASGGKLLPGDAAEREKVLEIEGIGSLLMDSLFIRSHEIRRDANEQSPALVTKEAKRAARCYDALEGKIGQCGEGLNLGSIAVVAALGYADWRHPGDEWRRGRDRLAGWFETMMKNPAVAETKPVF